MPDFVEGDFRGLIGGDSSNNRASTSAVTGNRDGSILERLEYMADGENCVATGAALLVEGTTIFTVAGAPINIIQLISVCMVSSDSTAATLRWSADGTDGSAATFTGASASRANQAAGSMIVCNFTALTTAPDLVTNGVGLAAITTNGIIVPIGIITSTIGSGPTTTGTYRHYMRYKPMGPGCTVTAAF